MKLIDYYIKQLGCCGERISELRALMVDAATDTEEKEIREELSNELEVIEHIQSRLDKHL